jgi:hypothetical protein
MIPHWGSIANAAMQFYIRGVDYQPGGQGNLTDPLADYDICSRDIPLFKELGLNTVRICKLPLFRIG